MKDIIDIIYAEPLDCYIEIAYGPGLNSIRFRKGEKELAEKKTRNTSFELEKYFQGKRIEFSCEPDMSGLSDFTRKVLEETGKIGYGRTITYSELAERIGTGAKRAVGGALGRNPIPIVIPCHRVVSKNGPGGYSAGLDIKKRLLELERNGLNNI